MYIYNRGDYLLMDTARWQAPKLLEVMNKYIIMDDVELTDISEKLTSLAVQGPRAREVLRDAGFNFDRRGAARRCRTSPGTTSGFRSRAWPATSRTPMKSGSRPPTPAPSWDALVRSGAKPVGTEALEMFRLAAGIPRYGQDITRALPAAGNRPAAGAQFQEGLLHRAGNRGAHSLARAAASQADRLCGRRSAARARRTRSSRTARRSARSPARSPFPAAPASARWRSAICARKPVLPGAELRVERRARHRPPASLQGAGRMNALPNCELPNCRIAFNSAVPQFAIPQLRKLCLTKNKPNSPSPTAAASPSEGEAVVRNAARAGAGSASRGARPLIVAPEAAEVPEPPSRRSATSRLRPAPPSARRSTMPSRNRRRSSTRRSSPNSAAAARRTSK